MTKMVTWRGVECSCGYEGGFGPSHHAQRCTWRIMAEEDRVMEQLDRRKERKLEEAAKMAEAIKRYEESRKLVEQRLADDEAKWAEMIEVRRQAMREFYSGFESELEATLNGDLRASINKN